MQISRGRNFYLIHRSNPKINDNSALSNRSNNIFEGIESTSQYFPTCPDENPFTIMSRVSTKLQFPAIQTQESKINSIKLSDEIKKLRDEEIFRIDETSKQKYNIMNRSFSQKKREKYLLQTPQAKNDKPNSQRRFSSMNTNEISKYTSKWETKVDKYLYKKAMTNEVVYNQDLRTRCGDQYFEQLVRDRHKEDMKPKPYIYSIKNDLQPTKINFVNYIKKLHPEIVIKSKMNLRGINRCRVQTESLNRGSEVVKTKQPRTNSTTMQTYSKVHTATSNYN